MITETNGVFHIRTEAYSYLFRVNAYGLLEHLHFGVPVKTEDVFALSCRAGLGWGSNIVLVDGDSESCPDTMALEWSGSGRGDYRESPVELCGKSTDFRYAGFEIVEGNVPMVSGLPQSHGGVQTLKVTLEQPDAGCIFTIPPIPPLWFAAVYWKIPGKHPLP